MEEENSAKPILCPVCGKEDCPVCDYWKNTDMMDRLFAENGGAVRLFALMCDRVDIRFLRCHLV